MYDKDVTCSSWVGFSLVYGFHTEQANACDGRTSDWYACYLPVMELMLVFLVRSISVLPAFVVILFIWLSHLRSHCIVTPRFLSLSTCSSLCPYWMYAYFTSVLFRVMESTLHLSGWKTIFPFFFPYLEFNKIILKCGTISVRFYCQVGHHIICK